MPGPDDVILDFDRLILSTLENNQYVLPQALAGVDHDIHYIENADRTIFTNNDGRDNGTVNTRPKIDAYVVDDEYFLHLFTPNADAAQPGTVVIDQFTYTAADNGTLTNGANVYKRVDGDAANENNWTKAGVRYNFFKALPADIKLINIDTNELLELGAEFKYNEYSLHLAEKRLKDDLGGAAADIKVGIKRMDFIADEDYFIIVTYDGRKTRDWVLCSNRGNTLTSLLVTPARTYTKADGKWTTSDRLPNPVLFEMLKSDVWMGVEDHNDLTIELANIDFTLSIEPADKDGRREFAETKFVFDAKNEGDIFFGIASKFDGDEKATYLPYRLKKEGGNVLILNTDDDNTRFTLTPIGDHWKNQDNNIETFIFNLPKYVNNGDDISVFNKSDKKLAKIPNSFPFIVGGKMVDGKTVESTLILPYKYDDDDDGSDEYMIKANNDGTCSISLFKMSENKLEDKFKGKEYELNAGVWKEKDNATDTFTFFRILNHNDFSGFIFKNQNNKWYENRFIKTPTNNIVDGVTYESICLQKQTFKPGEIFNIVSSDLDIVEFTTTSVDGDGNILGKDNTDNNIVKFKPVENDERLYELQTETGEPINASDIVRRVIYDKIISGNGLVSNNPSSATATSSIRPILAGERQYVADVTIYEIQTLTDSIGGEEEKEEPVVAKPPPPPPPVLENPILYKNTDAGDTWNLLTLQDGLYKIGTDVFYADETHITGTISGEAKTYDIIKLKKELENGPVLTASKTDPVAKENTITSQDDADAKGYPKIVLQTTLTGTDDVAGKTLLTTSDLDGNIQWLLQAGQSYYIFAKPAAPAIGGGTTRRRNKKKARLVLSQKRRKIKLRNIIKKRNKTNHRKKRII